MLYLFLSLVTVLLVLGPLVFFAMRTYPKLDLLLQGPWFKFAMRGGSEQSGRDQDSDQQE